MAASEDEIIRDQRERDGLTKAIADAETALAVSAPGTRLTLQNFVEQAKGRVATLDKKITDAKEAREYEARTQAAAVAALAAKETALSQSEKETYGGFLAKEFFTKSDFKQLEQFYAHTWDRLSEGGKDEMSHRVWEGIRHDEYRFTDLPKVVQEKEEDRIYAKLTNPAKKQDNLEQIPEADRAHFVRSYEAGNRKEAGQALNRDSFRKNVALDTSSPKRHQAADAERNGSDDRNMVAAAATNRAASPTQPRASSSLTNADVDALGLSGVKLADASVPPSAAAMPDASGTRVNAR